MPKAKSGATILDGVIKKQTVHQSHPTNLFQQTKHTKIYIIIFIKKNNIFLFFI
jgi:hypothetical protein